MKRYKLIFYVIIVIYFSTSVYFGFNLDKMFSKFGMFSFFTFLKNWAITGLILLLVEFAIENIHIFSLNRAITKLSRDNAKLKRELAQAVESKETLPPKEVSGETVSQEESVDKTI